MRNTKKVDLTNYPLVKEYVDYFEQYGELLDSYCHQVISRNNDINGNPYRLTIAYLKDGNRVGFEVRSGRTNIRHKFDRTLSKELLQIHVAPKEYKELKERCRIIIRCN